VWDSRRTQLSVLMVFKPPLTSEGMLEPRGQNQILTNVVVRSIAKKPPPFELNEAPYEFERLEATLHPELPFTEVSQLVSPGLTVPDIANPEAGILQPTRSK
jgi:hypothetical protein